LATISRADIDGWLKHCGYGFLDQGS
jgi:hypothetical protein